MKEINIANVLVHKRRGKGITQEELAAYIGVSKASVSKWETGQSYPDITFLPQLAAYFNISIDDLMGYSPQMTKEDITKLYQRLALSFANSPFDETIEECREIIKKYYACFPLLLQMTILLFNHHMLAKDTDTQQNLLHEICDLCKHIKKETEDTFLAKNATNMEAYCYLLLQKPDLILDLYDETIRPIHDDALIISKAYQLKGQQEKARESLQISMYQHLSVLVTDAMDYLMLNTDNLENVDEILLRTLRISDIYQFDKLVPNTIINIYFIAAQIYCSHKKIEKALDMLQAYADVCTNNFFPITLHGDSYFDSIDAWLQNLDLGKTPPRSEKLIKEDMQNMIIKNPAFSILNGQPRYNNIINQLKKMQ